MKKTLALLAAGLTLCLSLAACTAEPEETTAPPETTTQPITVPHDQSPTTGDSLPDNTLMLAATEEPGAELQPVRRQIYGNGSYSFADATADGSIRTFSTCYVTNIKEGETEEDYASRRALAMATELTPGTPYQAMVTANEELSEALGYPVYLVGYFTGSEPEATYWLVYLTRTEHYSYQFAFTAGAQHGMELEDTLIEHMASFELKPLEA